MTKPQKYRWVNATDARHEVEAMRYGDKHGNWHSGAALEIAQFVLGGFNVRAGMTVENEHIMDVVRPVTARWSPKENIADLDIIDPITRNLYAMKVGEWVFRDHYGRMMFLQNAVFQETYVLVEPELAESSDEEDLLKFILDLDPNPPGPRNPQFQEFAEELAAAIIQAGWARKEKP